MYRFVRTIIFAFKKFLAGYLKYIKKIFTDSFWAYEKNGEDPQTYTFKWKDILYCDLQQNSSKIFEVLFEAFELKIMN